MVFEPTRFAHFAERWADRAQLGELNSVLCARGSERANLLLHATTLVAARIALASARNRVRDARLLLDFGCGTGRLLRFFGRHGFAVVGTEVTPEMLVVARRLGLPDRAGICLTNGTSIPLRDESMDLIWVCGVLKYSLFEPDSRCRGGAMPDRRLEASSATAKVPYAEIAQEMYRVLRPGGFVVNLEMWVDAATDVFTPDFEKAGFATHEVRLLRRYLGKPERFLEKWRPWYRLPRPAVVAAGKAIAWARYRFDDPKRLGGGLRDYLFVWEKGRASISPAAAGHTTVPGGRRDDPAGRAGQ